MTARIHHIGAGLKAFLLEKSSPCRLQALHSLAGPSIEESQLNMCLRVVEDILDGVGVHPFRSLVDVEGVLSCLEDLDREVDSLAGRILVRFIDIGSVVVDFGNSQGPELSNELVVGHEENAIIYIRVVTHSFFL